MDVLNYTLNREAFENNLGTFYYAVKKDNGDKVLVLKIGKTLNDEKFLNEVKEYVEKEKTQVVGIAFMKSLAKEGDEWYAEYEYFEGKPISFVMSQARKCEAIKKMISSVGSSLDALSEAGISYGGLTTESVISTLSGEYKIVGVEFYNTEYKLEGNEDLYNIGYTDPKVSDLKFNHASDVYSLGRFTATMFLAEKFYTTDNYSIPNIPMLKPIQASIDKATQTDERFDSCKAFADSLANFKGTCPFTDHGSQVATYAYVGIVVLLIILDWCVNYFGWFGGQLGG